VAADGGVPRVQVEQRPGLARRALADNSGREKTKEIIHPEILNMAMGAMPAGEVPTTPCDRIFPSSRLYASMFVLGCIAACAAMIFFQWPRPPAAYVISAVILLVLWLAHRMIAARFHPSNWLVRLGDDGLFIHFRSYLNEHLSAEDPTVVFLPYSDVRSARMVRARTSRPFAGLSWNWELIRPRRWPRWQRSPGARVCGKSAGTAVPQLFTKITPCGCKPHPSCA